MMNYKKGKNIEEELKKENIPIENLPESFLWMQVKGGTKIFNVIDYAKKALDSNEYRSMVWSGSGGGIQKTISCAEIIKRQYDVHQVSRIKYIKVEEYWEPELEGLDEIVATREIPSIHILLSLDKIDDKTLGYQAPKTKTSFWESNTSSKPNTSSKQNNGNRFNKNNKKNNRNPNKIKTNESMDVTTT